MRLALDETSVPDHAMSSTRYGVFLAAINVAINRVRT